MNDINYYKLLDKLHLTESILREKIRPKLNFSWQDEPLTPLEIVRLCAEAARLLVDIGDASLKEIDVDACAKAINSMGNISTYTDERGENQTHSPPGLGLEGTSDNRGPDDTGSS